MFFLYRSLAWRGLRLVCLPLFLLTAFAGAVQAQQPAPDSGQRIRLFINCRANNCFEAYLKTELSFFQTVRDLAQADVQVLVVGQETAAGGTRYALDFIGQKQFQGMRDTAEVITQAAETDAAMRERLLHTIESGLAPFVVRTPWRHSMHVSYDQREGAALNNVADPWHNWVASISCYGSTEGESNRSVVASDNSVYVSKITPTHKAVLDGWYSYRRTRFTIADETVNVGVSNGGMRGYYAHALNDHWSAGGFVSAWYDQYRNIKAHYRLAGAVEYSVFPYRENVKRQLRIGYQTGMRHYSYYDTTVYNRIAEYRPYQQFVVVAIWAQPWGSVDALFQANALWDNLRQNRLRARLGTEVRLAQGLNLSLYGSGAVVNDQISLSRDEVDAAQLLLRGAQLPTSVLYDLTVGFTYTFGSRNNSIVNPRFNSIDE